MPRKKKIVVDESSPKVESAWDEYAPGDMVLVIGDLHQDERRERAIETAIASIFKQIKGRQFSKIILLGDLFDKKPTTKERVLLAQFLKRLRDHSKQIHFIIGNGKHTFEKGFIYEQDWMELCQDFYQHEELKLAQFVFGHYEVKGTKYINGAVSQSEKEVDSKKTYLLGHIHQPGCSFKNVNYVGSIYKTDFSESKDEKRIAIIENDQISWLPIESRPMYELQFKGENGTVQVAKPVKDFLQQTPAQTELDLKVVVETDSATLGNVHRHIARIKEKFNIEYYVQNIQMKDFKVSVPKNLDKDVLLKNYCQEKNVSADLVFKELSK